MAFPIGGGSFLDSFERADGLVGNDWSSFNAESKADSLTAQSVIRTFVLTVDPVGTHRRLLTYRSVGIVNNTISAIFPGTQVNKRGLFVRGVRSAGAMRAVVVTADGRILTYDSTQSGVVDATLGQQEPGFTAVLGTFTALAAGNKLAVTVTDLTLDVKVNDALVRSVTLSAPYDKGEDVGAYHDTTVDLAAATPTLDDFTSNTASNTGVIRNVVTGIVNPWPADYIDPLKRNIEVTTRRWGGDDYLIDDPGRVNMRWDRERRRRTISGHVVVHRISPDFDEFELLASAFPGRRNWAGIGGFLYIPSFPQLRRKETLWPDAT